MSIKTSIGGHDKEGKEKTDAINNQVTLFINRSAGASGKGSSGEVNPVGRAEDRVVEKLTWLLPGAPALFFVASRGATLANSDRKSSVPAASRGPWYRRNEASLDATQSAARSFSAHPIFSFPSTLINSATV